MKTENVHYRIKSGTLVKFGKCYGIVLESQLFWFPGNNSSSVDPYLYHVFSNGNIHEMIRESFIILQAPLWIHTSKK